nr:DUF2625 domain-containing protein [Burkholderia cepacia]
MRPLDELVNERESALPSLIEWSAAAPDRCVILPPSGRNGEILSTLQVTTRSLLGPSPIRPAACSWTAATFVCSARAIPRCPGTSSAGIRDAPPAFCWSRMMPSADSSP